MWVHASLILEENITSENKLSNSDINWNKNEQQTKILTMYVLHTVTMRIEMRDLNKSHMLETA